MDKVWCEHIKVELHRYIAVSTDTIEIERWTTKVGLVKTPVPKEWTACPICIQKKPDIEMSWKRTQK